MLAMDVVDTLRHRERLVERELNENVRDEQLVARLRELYKSQGIEVPDRIIQEGVKGLKESRFVYTPPRPGLARTLALFWVRRERSTASGSAPPLRSSRSFSAPINTASCAPREQAAEATRVELSQILPRDLDALHQAIVAEAQVPEARELADALHAQGEAAVQRGNAQEARQVVANLDTLASQIRQEYRLLIAGRPEDETGFFREHPSFQGRAYFVVVDAVDARGLPVGFPSATTRRTRRRPCRALPCAFRSRPSTPFATTRRRTASCRTPSLAQKRRGYLEPEFKMAVPSRPHHPLVGARGDVHRTRCAVHRRAGDQQGAQ